MTSEQALRHVHDVLAREQRVDGVLRNIRNVLGAEGVDGVGAENLLGASRNGDDFVANLDVARHLSVEKSDKSLRRPHHKGHVIKDNSIVDSMVKELDLVDVVDKERLLEVGEGKVRLAKRGRPDENEALARVKAGKVDDGRVEAAYVVLVLKHRHEELLEEAGDAVLIENVLGGRTLTNAEHRRVVVRGLKRLRERLVAPLRRGGGRDLLGTKKRIEIVPVAPADVVLLEGVSEHALQVAAADAVRLDVDEVAVDVEPLADLDLAGLFAE